MADNFWQDDQQEQLPIPGSPPAHTAPVAPNTAPTPGAADPAKPIRAPGGAAGLAPAQRAISDRERYSPEYCLRYLATDSSLWDMRAWHRYKDIKEIRAWVEQKDPDHKNSGHAVFCIDMVKQHGVPVDAIVQAILSNPHKHYAQRLAACMAGEVCPKSIDKDGKEVVCSDRDCWRCEGLTYDPYHAEDWTCPECGSVKHTTSGDHIYWSHPASPTKEKSPRKRGGNNSTKEDLFNGTGNGITAEPDGQGGPEPGPDALEREQPVVEPAGRPAVPEPDGPGVEGAGAA